MANGLAESAAEVRAASTAEVVAERPQSVPESALQFFLQVEVVDHNWYRSHEATMVVEDTHNDTHVSWQQPTLRYGRANPQDPCQSKIFLEACKPKKYRMR